MKAIGIWTVEERFISGDKEEIIIHIFRTKKEAELYKAKSDKAWYPINSQSIINGRLFIVRLLPCNVEYESKECSKPGESLLAEYCLYDE